jgi:hypothetical protein
MYQDWLVIADRRESPKAMRASRNDRGAGSSTPAPVSGYCRPYRGYQVC